jgi:hypothetical protein
MQTISSSAYIAVFPKIVTYLSDGWEADESNRGYPGSRNIEAHTATAAATARWCGDKLTSKFCKLGLELSQMIARGLILLGFRPSGVRTGHGLLEGGGHTSSLWDGEREKLRIKGSVPSHLLLPILGYQCVILRGGEKGSILLFFVRWS